MHSESEKKCYVAWFNFHTKHDIRGEGLPWCPWLRGKKMTLLRHGIGKKKLKGTQPKGPLVLLCHDFFTDSDYMITFLATGRTSYYWCFKLGRSNPVIPTTAPIKRTLHFESGEMSRWEGEAVYISLAGRKVWWVAVLLLGNRFYVNSLWQFLFSKEPDCFFLLHESSAFSWYRQYMEFTQIRDVTVNSVYERECNSVFEFFFLFSTAAWEIICLRRHGSFFFSADPPHGVCVAVACMPTILTDPLNSWVE